MTTKLYEALRRGLGIGKDNPEFLEWILTEKSSVTEAFDSLRKKPVIVQYAHCRNNQPCAARHYQGGILKDLQFYDKKEGKFGAHIWLDRRSFAIGFEDVFDIMLPETINEEAVKKKKENLGNLRIYSFETFAPDEGEECSVIHIDPFLAYLTLTGKERIKQDKKFLRDVRPVEAGTCLYSYHRESSSHLELVNF